MRFLTLVTTLLLAASVSAAAQSIAPRVIASAGGENTVGGVHVAWTIGEIAVRTLHQDDVYLTQGFHQPPVGTTGVPHSVITLEGVTVFPNPVRNELQVRVLESSGTVRVEIVDLIGRKVSAASNTPGSDLLHIDMSDMASGTYLVRVMVNDAWQTIPVTKYE